MTDNEYLKANKALRDAKGALCDAYHLLRHAREALLLPGSMERQDGIAFDIRMILTQVGQIHTFIDTLVNITHTRAARIAEWGNVNSGVSACEGHEGKEATND